MYGVESIAPRFLIPSKRIKVLYKPSEFYGHLCNGIRNAKNRVFLASLYLGKTEQELISVLSEALKHNEKLKVYVLVDGLRGTREAPRACSASLLAPLEQQYPARVHLSMYKTPKLGNVLGALLPKRIVEGAGLQHMKLYGFDDEIILSGANLSKDYFTNRQDRYISIYDAKLTDFYFDVQSAVSKLSCTLTHAFNEQGFALVPPPKTQQLQARTTLAKLFKPTNHSVDGLAENEESTEVYPIAQFTPLGLGNELAAMTRICGAARNSGIKWLLTAGYFNLEPSLAKQVTSAHGGEVIVAAPEANGFYNSRGISGRIPSFYSVLVHRFMQQIPADIMLPVRCWQRGVVGTPGGWSYHAKGVWLSHLDGGPFLTYIGSSNLTRRSYKHDLECGAVLVASQSGLLSRQLLAETERLKQHCRRLLSIEAPTPKLTLCDRALLLLFGDRL